MNKKILRATILLGIIFLLGLFLRFYRLNLNLPPLYADETSQYYIANSISTNIENFVFNLRNSLISYTWFLGFTPLGARLPAAVYGSILVVFSFFFGMACFKGNRSISLLMALLTALAPWSFMISRIGHASVPIMLFFSLLHVILYLRAKKIIDYLVCLFPLAVAAIYYPSMVLIVPLVSIPVLADIFKLLVGKQKLLFLGFSVPVILISGFLLSSRYNLFKANGRAFDSAIWRDVNTPWEIDKYRALSWNSEPSLFSFRLPPEQLGNKLVYNRAMANITTFTKNYLSFFTPNWLFLKGDAILRHSTGQVGTFYPFLIPFMLYGAFAFFSGKSPPDNQQLITKNRTIFLIWLLASPIPAAITKDGAGYLLRAVTMLPFLTYFCALGIVESFNLIKKNWRIPYGILVGLIGLYSAYYFFFGYFHVYPSLSARSYEYGFKELSDFQVAHNNAPILVIWDGYYHNNDFRFWQKTPFDRYNSFKVKEIVVGQSHFNQTFPNLYFVNPRSVVDIEEFVRQYRPDYLVLPDRYFVNYPVSFDEDYTTPSAVINYPDQTTALKIFSVKN